MQYKRERSSERNRERARRREAAKKKKRFLCLLGVLLWILVSVCVICIVQLRHKLRELNELLNQAGRPVVAEPDLLEAMSDSDEGAEATGKFTDDKWMSEDYADKCGLEYVERPMERSRREVLERLQELGADNPLIEDIWEKSASYPEKMLEALANNPEMADFVAGWQGAETNGTAGLTNREKEQEYPLFLQWDPRWGYVEYGDESCIGLAGCGPTCLSMVLYYLTRDETLTPDRIGTYSMRNGYYMSGTGTAWALFEDVAGLYGLSVRQPKASEWEMEAALDDGAVIILSMGQGEFTLAGHFIVVYGYDKNGFFVNDSNCVARSRKQWSYSEIEKQIKHMWIFSEDGSSMDGIVVDYYG